MKQTSTPTPASPASQAPAYGAVSKALHWLMFLLLLAQFLIALGMPDIHRGVVPETWIKLHMSFGILILLVVIPRALWRLGHPVPPLADGSPPWQQWSAHAIHRLLYALLLILPILGWGAASARDWQIGFFGVFALPHLLAAKAKIGLISGDIHSVLSWTLLAVIGLHVAAALYHYFILRDRVLQRMLPGGGD